MSIDFDYYSRALETVRQRKTAAEQKADMQKSELYSNTPELRTLDDNISAVYANAVKKQLSGEAVDFLAASKESLNLQKTREELIKSAGFELSDLLPKYTCKKCSDSGFSNGRLCDCVKTVAEKLIFDEINRDVPLESSTFDTFQLKYYPDTPDENGQIPREIMGKIKALCEKYAAAFTDKSDSILFCGRTGLGKTHLSLAIANAAIAKGYNVIYAPLCRVLQKIEEEHFSSDNNSNRTLNSVINCDLLIIDDLGTEFSTQFTVAAVYDIINSRTLSGKPTIINTNLSLNEIEKKYSERVVSRLSSKKWKMFTFIGEDIRQKL